MQTNTGTGKKCLFCHNLIFPSGRTFVGDFNYYFITNNSSEQEAWGGNTVFLCKKCFDIIAGKNLFEMLLKMQKEIDNK